MSKYNLLIARLNQELANTERTVQRAVSQVQKAQSKRDPDYYDAAALNLQKFYMGAERIFVEVAREIDAYLPSGPDWHKQLLQQMSLENGEVRPAVLSTEAYQTLELDYRGFRHVASHLYAFELKPERIRELANDLPDTYSLLSKDIKAFCQYLRLLAQHTATIGSQQSLLSSLEAPEAGVAPPAQGPQQLWQQYSQGIPTPIEGQQLTAIARCALQDNLAPEAITQMLLEAPYLKDLQQRQGLERAQDFARLAIRNAVSQIRQAQQPQPLPKGEQGQDFGPEL